MADFDLPKEEFLSLRREVEFIQAELSSLERNCLFAVAGAFAWFSTQPLKVNFAPAWFMPGLLVLFCAGRAWQIRKRLGFLSQYLARIEEANRKEDKLCMGWEHFQNMLNPSRPGLVRKGSLGKLHSLFWLLLAVFSFSFGLLGYLG